MCYCGLEARFADCCEVFHSGDAEAPTAEKLMRSRYSAFVVKNFEYLKETQDPQTYFEIDHEGNEKWAYQVEFVKLEILRAEENKNKAVVEFKAHFKENGEEGIHHEISQFRKQGETWYFRMGKTPK